MVIEYQVPNGTMMIDADIFFQEASLRVIRKMLKDYRRYVSGADGIRKLSSWLKEQIDQFQTETRVARHDFCMLMTLITDLNQKYRRMKDPCSEVFTRDREKLWEARLEIQMRKQEAIKKKHRILELQKQDAKYLKVLELVREISEE